MLLHSDSFSSSLCRLRGNLLEVDLLFCELGCKLSDANQLDGWYGSGGAGGLASGLSREARFEVEIPPRPPPPRPRLLSMALKIQLNWKKIILRKH